MRRRYLSVLCFLLIPALGHSEQGKSLRLGTFDFIQYVEGLKAVEDMVREALIVHGYDMSLEYYPGKRLMAQLNGGMLDGDLYRSVNLSRGFENVVRVEEPILVSCGLLFRLQNVESISGKASAVRFGIYDGVPEAISLSRKMFPQSELVFFKKLTQGVDLLEHGRIDILAIPSGQESEFNRLIRKPVVLSGGMALSPSYMHLHARHRQLALDLAPTLKLLKSQTDINLCDADALNRRLSKIEPSS